MEFQVTTMVGARDRDGEDIPVVAWTPEIYNQMREAGGNRVERSMSKPFTQVGSPDINEVDSTSAHYTVTVDVEPLDVMEACQLSQFAAPAVNRTDVVSPDGSNSWDDQTVTIQGTFYDDGRPREELELDVLDACQIEPAEPPTLIFNEDDRGGSWRPFYVDFDILDLFEAFGNKEFACHQLCSTGSALDVEFVGY